MISQSLHYLVIISLFYQQSFDDYGHLLKFAVTEENIRIFWARKKEFALH